MSTQATLITTGMLPFLVLVSAGLTAPVSLALLALYRRAILASMARTANGTLRPPQPAAASPPQLPLQIELVDPAFVPATAARREARRSLWIVTAIYVAAGLVYALVLSGAWLYFTRNDGFVVARFLWLLSCYVWPVAMAVGLLVAVNGRQRMAVAVAYFVMLMAVVSYGLYRNAELAVGQLALFWLYTNLPATLLLLVFLHRRVRAVGPLVLAFMVVAVTGSQLAVSALGSSEAAMRALVDIGQRVGLGGHGLFFATMALGAVLAGVLGWFWLKWLGRRHLARRSNDQGLTLDAMWLLFGVVQSITLSFEGWLWVFTGPVAFAAYKAVTWIGFAIARLDKAAGHPPSLLLLRVFALGARSEQLFDGLAKRWLRSGDISLIAGPDLATTTVEPHEFLDFVGGRLSRQFVHDAADLECRLRARALGADSDGRHRVNEFFCHADTWQPVMQRLAASADVVLMDLRSFSATNQGCRYEIGQLLNTVPLTRVVLLIDADANRGFLESTLQMLWQTVSADSPNRSPGMSRLRMIAAQKPASLHLNPLLDLLYAAAAQLSCAAR